MSYSNIYHEHKQNIEKKIKKNEYISIIIISIVIIIMISIRIDETITTEGVILSRARSNIKSPINLNIEKFYVTHGDYIEKNNKIAKLDEGNISREIQLLEENRISIIKGFNEFKQERFSTKVLIPLQIKNAEILVEENKLILDNKKNTYINAQKLFTYGSITNDSLSNSLLEYNLQSLKYENSLNSKNELEQRQQQISDNIYYKYNVQFERYYKNQISNIGKKLKILEQIYNNPYITAEVSGIVSFPSNSLNKSIFVYDENEIICTIIQSEDYYIKSSISNIDYPYIKKLDPVIISIDALPVDEFGIITGSVSKKYEISNEEQVFTFDIDLENDIDYSLLQIGLVTHNKILLKKNMSVIEFIYTKAFNKNIRYEKLGFKDFYIIKRKKWDVTK